MAMVVALYVRPGKREPVSSLHRVIAAEGRGLDGDHKVGGKRQVTLLAREDWEAACREVGRPGLDPGLRRANVVLEGMSLADVIGRRLRLGDVVVEVLGETAPCERMEEVCPGLQQALGPGCRGGVFGRIEAGGEIAVGQDIEVMA